MGKINVCLIAPTGIGLELGGHAGDFLPCVKLIGSCCDKLITHPNACNASDIMEMPENGLYVEGSILNRFLRGEIYLKEVFYNRILLVVNKPVDNDTINAVNAARVTIGSDIRILELNTELKMNGFFKNGKADGKVEGWLELCEQVENYDFDALAIQSSIKVDKKNKFEYLNGIGGINPWGAVEAIASKLIADKIDKPVAHSPYVNWSAGGDDLEDFNEVVDPRMSAEMVSICYLHCILKGLHKAPRINYESGLSNNDVDFMISPINCVGDPHYACIEAGIPVIAVKENKSILKDEMPDDFIIVDNYIEAAGLLMAYKAGVSQKSVRRPFI
jgi:hypothetical protein